MDKTECGGNSKISIMILQLIFCRIIESLMSQDASNEPPHGLYRR